MEFNDCINNRDIDGLARLMAVDHTLIDRQGTITRPKEVVLGKWKEFFRMFPEYRNTFTHLESREHRVFVVGFASWSAHRFTDVALWTATIVDDRVQEWRVYDDNETNRKSLNLT
jgi:ketosteroid isomerase-like protein